MTRKCFVKLLMSNGYSKNEAMSMAIAVQKRKTSYSEEYPRLVLRKSIIESVASFTHALQETSRQFSILGQKLKMMFSSIIGGELTRITHALQIGSRIMHPQS